MTEFSDDTTELPTYSRAIGGTDPHPVGVDALVGRIDSQIDRVSAAAESRGTVTGAEVLLAEVRELIALSQSLEGRAVDRVEMLRSTAAAVLETDEADYDEVMARIHGDAVAAVHEEIEDRKGGER